MMKIYTGKRFFLIAAVVLFAAGCSKETDSSPSPQPVVPPLTISAVKLNGSAVTNGNSYYNINTTAVIQYNFSAPVNRTTVATGINIRENGAGTVAFTASYSNSDSVLLVQPVGALKNISSYTVSAATSLKSVGGRNLSTANGFNLITKIDSTPKFPLVSDDELLTKVQQQTFKYFWDYAHPVSGLARERSNGDENVVTSGGSGFGIMAIPVAISRNFITRAEGLERMQKIVGFLKNTAQTFHGAFPHWLHGASGAVVAFSTKDNGADLVETSFLMAGLLTARQYFNDAGTAETTLRNDINTLWGNVEWDWFRKSNENVLYWHWSPVYNWEMNVPIRGWNECLITYIMAASSATHGIPAAVYTNGWASSTSFTNGATYFGYQLPLGPSVGGPLFFSHYSFLGVNPNGLQDTYANYGTQTTNHTLINYNHCRTNPNNQFGYSADNWGLTASDIKNGYTASSPTNDVGVIAPTAALSSFPYTPAESMRALKFFYYTLGDKLWKDYGFVDAFALKDAWFAGSFLAIDQGPIIVMIENYRTGLLWNLFTSCPEVKTGMRSLGFTAPYL
jgi:hypothetical protein